MTFLFSQFVSFVLFNLCSFHSYSTVSANFIQHSHSADHCFDFCVARVNLRDRLYAIVFEALLTMAASTTTTEKTVSFTKAMRVATREIHNVSDGLVNAKLAFGKNWYF